MSKFALTFGTEPSAGDEGVHIIDTAGDVLSVYKSVSLGVSGSNIKGIAVSKDGSRIAVCNSASASYDKSVTLLDVELNILASVKISGANGLFSAFSSDGKQLIVSHTRTADGHVALFNVENDTFTLLDQYDQGVSNNIGGLAIRPGTSEFVQSLGDSRAIRMSFDAAGMTFIEQYIESGLSFGTGNNISFNSDGSYVAGDRASLNVVSINGSMAFVASGSDVGGKPIWKSDSIIINSRDRYSFDGSALTQTDALLEFGTEAALSDDGTRILAGDDSGNYTLYDADTLAVLDTIALSDNPEEITAIPAESGPTTPEEKFNASYADASAALPKITALIRPADVQRSIDTDVSNLKDGPNFYTVECIFDLGELSNLNPYNATTEKPRVFFVKDDQPGLRDGKNLLLKGYQIRSADPSVPVTCTFWGY